VAARVAFSPHAEGQGLLDDIAGDIDAAESSVLFSLAFLGQIKNGTVGPALGRAMARGLHCMGIADARVHAANLGVEVLSAEGRKRVVRAESLTGRVPEPFRSEATGLAGLAGTERGTRMHHKFVVLDFDKPSARVYFGSHNFSIPADKDNGENLVVVQHRVVATAYMIEAVRIYDHYRFRVAVADARGGGSVEPLALRLPPQLSGKPAWWRRDWDDPARARDRRLFS
jgi:phosphatidylserine/phosphatidylglycerophosphate/cardiolipin synthase-like enzyme